MDDRLARLEQRLGEVQGKIGEYRRDLTARIDLAYRWSIITLGVGLIITWLGVFMLLARGTALLRRLLLHG
jgi:hypothetical protein